ncbi:hypothetical protein FHS70_004164 [Flammeovirga yaeyamensis]|nr:hypothetical protein [Flammeovirga yaeyamensis]
MQRKKVRSFIELEAQKHLKINTSQLECVRVISRFLVLANLAEYVVQVNRIVRDVYKQKDLERD